MSYRRADGRLAVDWIAERLGALDAVDGVESAFHDAALRVADNFPDALDTEIRECEIVVAVIGPEWEGRRDDGSARIRDEDDWVVRELAAAFAQGKTIVPGSATSTTSPSSRSAIVRESAAIPEPYASNATGRLAAEPLADGGWGFRLVLALPAIVAVVGVIVVRSLL